MPSERNWSLNLGRWGGLRLRLHISFLLFAVCALLVSCFSADAAGGVHWIAPLGLLIMLVSVVIHALGHFQASRHLGIGIDEMVLAPWGEFTSEESAHDDPVYVLAQLAGVVANVIVCLICVPILLIQGVNPVVFFDLLTPNIDSSVFTWVVAVKLVFWINALLVFVNLLPVFPFDGGQALRLGLSQRWGTRRALRFVQRLSQFAAIGLLAGAFLSGDQGGESLLPTWFALSILALLMFFGAPAEQPIRAEASEADGTMLGYDFSEGYTSLERSSQSLDEYGEDDKDMAGFVHRSAHRRGKHSDNVETDEELEVDAILARVHQQGLESLSDDERRLLERVSARYRNRLGDRS